MLDDYNLYVDAARINSKAGYIRNKVITGQDRINAIKLIVSIIDLTSLEGTETADRISALCSKAINPLGEKLDFLHVAAVCVFPAMVVVVKKNLLNSGVKAASVAGSFPDGQVSLETKINEVRKVIDLGADEIDMVINRKRFLNGDFDYTFSEVGEIKKVCGLIPLKVILETGEIESYERIRNASLISMTAGADFIKTSTGKMKPGATLPATQVMLEAIKDFYEHTGKRIGIKAAGGIRTAKDVLGYYALVKNTLGNEWLTPDLFRIGASSLLDDLLTEYTEVTKPEKQKA